MFDDMFDQFIDRRADIETRLNQLLEVRSGDHFTFDEIVVFTKANDEEEDMLKKLLKEAEKEKKVYTFMDKIPYSSEREKVYGKVKNN